MIFLILGILIALPAFFGAGEIAILRLRPSRVQSLLEENKHGARAINRLQNRFKRALMVSQLGTTLPLIAIGWIGNSLGKHWWTENSSLAPYFDVLLFLGLAIICTLISGLLPKALVLSRPETSALRLGPILESVMRGLSPLIKFIEIITSSLLGLIGLTTKWDALVPALSAGELEKLIETGGVTGLRPDEKNILEGVFALHDTQVREVMVPRSGMVTLPYEVSFSELMKAVHKTRHARFIVIGESLDDVKGILDLRQLAEPISKGEMQPHSSLSPYLQEVPKILETLTLAELLPKIKSGEPFLLVVDEHGGTEGLVTAADLTGEIVGDELESNKNPPVLISQDGKPGSWLAAGELEIIELNRQLNQELPEADSHHTLAGFLLEKLQHIPVKGEKFVFEDLEFEITRMNGPRIEQVRLILHTVDLTKT